MSTPGTRINLEILKAAVESRTRRLSATWTVEPVVPPPYRMRMINRETKAVQYMEPTSAFYAGNYLTVVVPVDEVTDEFLALDSLAALSETKRYYNIDLIENVPNPCAEIKLDLDGIQRFHTYCEVIDNTKKTIFNRSTQQEEEVIVIEISFFEKANRYPRSW